MLEKQLKRFIKSYWQYYLELEEQFIETRRYIAFDIKNEKTFSIEYLKLYQAVCSEIDVVGKEIAFNFNKLFYDNNKKKTINIQKWGLEIQQKIPFIKDIIICFNEERYIQPFKNWEYEKYLDKNKCKRIRLVDGKVAISWWSDYNKVKHQRIGLVTNTQNFFLANQKNLVMSLAALFVLEYQYIKLLKDNEDFHYASSRLFTFKDNQYA